MKWISTKVFIFMVLMMCTTLLVVAQKPVRWTSSEIHNGIKKLNFLGSALYVAAHPDDENTTMIAYLANEVRANVAYLSLTRGDGGQNEIGPEIREFLGLIRTQELLAARRTDGGSQLFSRANDFGYSKSPDETLKIWNRDEVLSDVVWAIRKWRPDVIINRFSHDSGRRTHGHHTSSAILSHEAFDLVGDPSIYPEQLKFLEPWQPRRLFFNTSWWFYGSRENFAKADKTKMMGVDLGVYYANLGKSNTEISAESRSMHKSQGFGRTGTRGRSMEYLQLLKGDMPKGKEDIFEGINTTWTRIKGGAAIGKILMEVENEFDFDVPGKSIPKLVKAYRMINSLPEGYWKRVKLNEIKKVIKACMGFYFEAAASDFSATPGEQLDIDIEVINRSTATAEIKSIAIHPDLKDTTLNLALVENEGVKLEQELTLPKNMGYSSPYWLNQPWELGMYTVKDQLKRGVPENKRPLKVKIQMLIQGTPIDFETDVIFKRNDPVAGEVYRPFEVLPPATVNMEEKVLIFADDSPRPLNVLVRAGKNNVKGKVGLKVPEGWEVKPESVEVDLKLKGQEQAVAFQLFPPTTQSEVSVNAYFEIDGSQYDQEIFIVDYKHIPLQTVLLPSTAKAVKVDLRKAGEKIGYVLGIGDVVPENLEQIGYDVTLLNEGDLNIDRLKEFDAVVMGARAYNVHEWLRFGQKALLEYVNQGGTMVVQYNKSYNLKLPMKELGPYPFKISRNRTSVEEAEMRILEPDHQILNKPNKITQADFEGWVQERGLYFPNEWDEKYTPILSSNDPGEKPNDGGLLVGKYGEGHFVYTSYSWFRELPAGVPGAYRLFVNMISLGNEMKP